MENLIGGQQSVRENSLLKYTKHLWSWRILALSHKKSFILLGTLQLFDSCKGKILERVRTNGAQHYREPAQNFPSSADQRTLTRLTVQALV